MHSGEHRLLNSNVDADGTDGGLDSVVDADGMDIGMKTCEGDRRSAGCVDHHENRRASCYHDHHGMKRLRGMGCCGVLRRHFDDCCCCIDWHFFHVGG